MLTFNESLVAFRLDAPDARSVIYVLAGKLHHQGLVVAEYGQQTHARELVHPTGLPTQPFCIAFPHADAEGVKELALALATLSKPVVFKNMADPEEDLQVFLVLMLANRNLKNRYRLCVTWLYYLANPTSWSLCAINLLQKRR